MNKWIELLKKNDYLNVKKHIKSGVDLEEENDNGESVLACAVIAKCDIDLLMLLIDSGANIFAFDNEGVSIFDLSITYNNLEIFNYLLEQGIDVNKTTRRSGFTALMAATCYGRVGIVKKLIEKGANQKAQDSKGFSAVDFARKMNKKSVLELFNINENT